MVTCLPTINLTVMDLCASSRCFMIFAILYFLLLMNMQLSAHEIHHPGVSTTEMRTLYFSNFHLSSNPGTTHDIKLLGSAKISDAVGSIQIPDASAVGGPINQAGRAIFASPIRLSNPVTKTLASFQTTFSFQFTSITGTDTSILSNASSEAFSSHDRGGSGLAFVLVPDEFTVGRAGPWLGMLNDACNDYKVFAVEFDTSHDADFGDPSDDHVGINLGSIVSMKTIDLSKSSISLHDGSIHQARINYDGSRKWIDVYLGLNIDHMPNQPILSLPLDLSCFLNEFMFVGFSASTTNSPQIHNVLSWNFTSTIQGILQVPSERTCQRNILHQFSKYPKIPKSSASSSFLIFVCVVGLCVLTLSVLYCNSSRMKSSITNSYLHMKQRPTPPSKPRSFKIHEIYRATRRFSKLEVLNSDLKGVLYRGTLPTGCQIAVKRLSPCLEHLTSPSSNCTRAMKRISVLTQISHPSLVTIKGWCYDSEEIIIVYDYHQNGSLDRWLFGVGALPWTRRSKLIQNIAEALTFLHSKDIVHGNLKTSSVFLDINYRAVLGDYALVPIIPEYSREENIIIGKKRDVFGLGMLVIETVAGRRSVSVAEKEEMSIFEYACCMQKKGERNKVVDERMGSGVVSEQALHTLDIGLLCTLEENDRVSMEDVVQFLNMDRTLPNFPPKHPAPA